MLKWKQYSLKQGYYSDGEKMSRAELNAYNRELLKRLVEEWLKNMVMR